MAKWDEYFHTLCQATACQVQCPSRSIGVVIARGKYVVATGYNGPPSGFPHPGSGEFVKLVYNVAPQVIFPPYDQPCPRKALDIRSGQELSLCPCAHAERNAIDSAARLGHATEGCVLYLNAPIPCLDCTYSIVNSGIVEVVVERLAVYPQPGFTGDIILRECGIRVREFEL